MYDQISQQFINFGRNAADTALKAQQIASEAFAKSLSMQMEVAEQSVSANGEFAKKAAEVRDAEGAQKIWPEGSELVRTNMEKVQSLSKEMLDLSVKTGEQFSELFQNSFEAAKAETEKAQAKATKTTKAAAK